MKRVLMALLFVTFVSVVITFVMWDINARQRSTIIKQNKIILEQNLDIEALKEGVHVEVDYNDIIGGRV